MVDTFMSDMDRLCSRLHRVGRLFPLRLHGGPALRVHCTCILHRHVNGLQGVLPLDTLLWPWINLGVHSVGRITCPAGGVPPMSMLPPTWIPRTPACLHPAPIQLEDSPPIEIADSQEQEASSPPRRCPLSPPKTSPPRAADSTHLHTAGKTQLDSPSRAPTPDSAGTKAPASPTLPASPATPASLPWATPDTRGDHDRDQERSSLLREPETPFLHPWQDTADLQSLRPYHNTTEQARQLLEGIQAALLQPDDDLTHVAPHLTELQILLERIKGATLRLPYTKIEQQVRNFTTPCTLLGTLEGTVQAGLSLFGFKATTDASTQTELLVSLVSPASHGPLPARGRKRRHWTRTPLPAGKRRATILRTTQAARRKVQQWLPMGWNEDEADLLITGELDYSEQPVQERVRLLAALYDWCVLAPMVTPRRLKDHPRKARTLAKQMITHLSDDLKADHLMLTNDLLLAFFLVLGPDIRFSVAEFCMFLDRLSSIFEEL